jgi:hypothetical protein
LLQPKNNLIELRLSLILCQARSAPSQNLFVGEG